jgi:PAS domain S-box-containing protein
VRGSRWLISIAGAVGVGATYFLAARLSLFLLEKPDGVAVFWPAAGVASGVLIVVGASATWPVIVGVTAATIAANLLGDRNFASSAFFAAANVGEALLVAGLIARFYGSPFDLNSLSRVLGLFAATAVGTAASGVVGTLGFFIFHSPTASITSIWLHWFASDSLGTIIVVPLVVAVAVLARDFPPKEEAIEGGLALAALSGLCALLNLQSNQRWTIALALVLLSPLFVWIAARLRPAFTAIATFICAIAIVWMTTFAIGIFDNPRLLVEDRILSAQAAILAISFGALVMAALFDERRLYDAAIVESETRLQEALKAGGVFAFDWDFSVSEFRYSQNASEILGLDSKKVFSSAEWLARVHPDDRARIMPVSSNADANPPSHSVTFRYLRPRGDELWLEQTAVADFDSNARVKRIHGLIADITERKRLEREISEARQSAEQADHAKSTFLAAASHDLRQPLQTLKLLQGTLEHIHPDGAERELVVGIGQSLDTMSGILSSLLDINQLEAGTLHPTRTEFAIGDLFQSVMLDYRHLIEEKGLRWRLVKSRCFVSSDRRMLETMVRNLISNAVRYTDRGSILLGCRRASDQLRIEVWDSGIGITADQLPRIFDEHYQVPGSERGGFGLGLAIVKRLGDMLGHGVRVRSTPEKGTVFSVEVPLARAGVVESVAVRTLERPRNVFRGTVVVLEDEASLRYSLNRLLKATGIHSLLSATVSDVISQIERENASPSLVLCDYNLLGSVNGLECIESLRAALGWQIPAIVMTGDIRSSTIQEIKSRRISVLIKPFEASDLLQLIDRVYISRN